MIIQEAKFQPSLTLAQNRARGFSDNSLQTAGEFTPEEGIITTNELRRVADLLGEIGISGVADSYNVRITAARAQGEDLLSIDAPNIDLVTRYSQRVGITVGWVVEFPSSVALTQEMVENPSLLNRPDENILGKQGFAGRFFGHLFDKIAA